MSHLVVLPIHHPTKSQQRLVMSNQKSTSDPMALTGAEALEVESRSIDFIPENERRGHAKDLFSLWFGANTMAITLVTGAIAGATGLGLFWSAVAIIIGAVAGTAFMAYHSAQGPQLGLPQMIQSRAQFGFYGANIPMVIVVAMYLGFYAGGAIIGAQALEILFGIKTPMAVAILSALSLVLVLFGYKMMHVIARVITPIYFVVFALLTTALITNWETFPSSAAVPFATFSLTPFMLIMSIIAAYYITYGPYVADYSRYLPSSTSTKSAFWYTFAGTVISAIWIMILGAAIQTAFGKLDAMTATAAVAVSFGAWLKILTLVTLVVGVANIGAFNIYGAMMSVLTIVTTLNRRLKPNGAVRAAYLIGLCAIGGGLAGIASKDFVLAYEHFIFFLVTFLIPWSAVNLVDYYYIRRGRYSAEELFRPDGQYGGFNAVGLGTYIFGCLCQIPFISQGFFTGPIAKNLGFDVAWIVGIIVPGFLYYFLARKRIETLPAEMLRNT
jgi:NCS1 family nucleobase:cation symporter-1